MSDAVVQYVKGTALAKEKGTVLPVKPVSNQVYLQVRHGLTSFVAGCGGAKVYLTFLLFMGTKYQIFVDLLRNCILDFLF